MIIECNRKIGLRSVLALFAKHKYKCIQSGLMQQKQQKQHLHLSFVQEAAAEAAASLTSLVFLITLRASLSRSYLVCSKGISFLIPLLTSLAA